MTSNRPGVFVFGLRLTTQNQLDRFVAESPNPVLTQTIVEEYYQTIAIGKLRIIWQK